MSKEKNKEYQQRYRERKKLGDTIPTCTVHASEVCREFPQKLKSQRSKNLVVVFNDEDYYGCCSHCFPYTEEGKQINREKQAQWRMKHSAK